MPLQKINLRPGLYREGTDYSNEGGWYDGDKVRFRSGQAEKIGGWVQVAVAQFLGLCRALWTWTTLNGQNLIGVGTNLKYYIYNGGTYADITPITQTDILTATPITTTSGSAVLTIFDGVYIPNVGDYVIFAATAAVGGISTTILNQEYVITSVDPTTDKYTVVAYSSQVTASGLIPGTAYTIQYVGDTVWTAYGAPNNLLGTVFTATSVGIGSGLAGVIVKASSGATGGGTVTAQYELPIGTNISTINTGWGTGPWSRGAWDSSYTAGFASQLRLWSNDNFGQDLVINPRGGPIFYWQAANGVQTRAVSLQTIAKTTTSAVTTSSFTAGQLTITVANATGIYPGSYFVGTPTNIPAGTYVTSAYVIGSTSVPLSAATTGNSSGTYSFSYSATAVPLNANYIICSSIQQFIIAYGTNSYTSTTNNPMTVRWCDQGNPAQWTPQVTNQSGEFTLTNGSTIIKAQTTRVETLIWTDSCLYTQQYIGYPYVYSFNVLMDNITIISPNAAITVNNVTYWMGRDKFYLYNGVVSTLPCALRQYIFGDINLNQAYQVFAGSNEGFNEVWWFYCSNESNNTVDKYVIYNYVEQCWSYGTMARTAWLQYGIQPYPVAADYNSRLLYHEVGTDDVSTASPQPIVSYITSSTFGIEAGEHFGFVWRMLPDINFNGSSVNNPSIKMTLFGKANSGSAPTTSDVDTVTSLQNYTTFGVYTVQEFTGQVYTRIRARQMAFQIVSDTLGTNWQLGTPRIDVKPAGKR
jgi:hypothetical protein